MGGTRCRLILLSFDVLVCVSLLFRYQGFVVVCHGYFIGNFGLLEKRKRKSVCVCKLTLDFILFFLLCRFYQVSQICT
jgi:hypothetical protein